MKKLPGIVKFSYDEDSKKATVVFNPTLVDKGSVSQAISKANGDMSDKETDLTKADNVLGNS